MTQDNGYNKNNKCVQVVYSYQKCYYVETISHFSLELPGIQEY